MHLESDELADRLSNHRRPRNWQLFDLRDILFGESRATGSERRLLGGLPCRTGCSTRLARRYNGLRRYTRSVRRPVLWGFTMELLSGQFYDHLLAGWPEATRSNAPCQERVLRLVQT